MASKRRFSYILFTLIIPCFLLSCTHTGQPRKPGPDFVWIKTRTTADGTVVPGHWKYTGIPGKHRSWVPGHYGPNGKWIAGHWKSYPKPFRGRHWVAGHYGKRGRWVPGHYSK